MLTLQLAALLLPGLAAGAFAGTASDRLREEPSAFLRANAGSPVDWMPWGEAAFARARLERKPVFLFMGYFTSELARAMRRQTFANPETAQWLNQQFVCVIVDRDERPGLASLYQAYVGDVKQLAGWPINVWLTPELVPFDGATYLSPSEDWGRPGFLKQAKQALDAWKADPVGCRKRAAEAVAQLTPAARSAPPAAWTAERSRARLAAAAQAWRDSFDSERGGFGDLPKEPEPELIRFLLRQSPADREAALKTLRALSTSAVRDPLDGGFFRYATDAAWRLPSPQKTLSDQARIALAFLDAAQGEDARTFEQCARGALGFALGHFAHPDGTFAAAQDATADEFVGYYAWTAAEIDNALGADAPAFKRAHGVEPGGNVPSADDPSGQYSSRNLLRSSAVADPGLAAAAARLLALRDRRPAPPLDGRATAGAHGLMLGALARAGAQLGDSRYLDAAERSLDAVKKAFILSPDGDLRRLAGSAEAAGADDYAALAFGCREVGRAAKDKAADALAARLLARLDKVFYDPASRRYFASPPGPIAGIFVRPFASGDPPGAEALALLSGGPRERAAEIAGGLLDSLDEANVRAPGDALLALGLFAEAEPGK
ncbi:MAG TPA: DUF255 domain-containing protein [Opitutaceae bacterium]|nr:DUF255 domain-containing protein [Opitutaceae bacterium]